MSGGPAGPVLVREAEPGDAEAWVRLRTALWPESPQDHPPEIEAYFADPPDDASCLVAEDAEGRVLGFAEVGMRRYAEGCRSSPVAYLEGIYVDPSVRGAGFGRALVVGCEAWGRARRCTELASDRALENEDSGAFHVAAGFEEVSRIVCYRKKL